MDFGAGTFDSVDVPHNRVIVCLVAKYAFVTLLVGHGLLRWLAPARGRAVLRLLTLGLVLRLATMAAVLFSPASSVTSMMRMVGELGPIAVMATVASLAVLVLDFRSRSLASLAVGFADAEEQNAERDGAMSVPLAKI
jgi:hypothetical protein